MLAKVKHVLGCFTHFPAVLQGVVERKASNALRLGTRGDLERLNDTSDGRVLETGVLAPVMVSECNEEVLFIFAKRSIRPRRREVYHLLGVFPDNANVDVLVTGVHTGQRLGNDDRSVNVQSLTHGDLLINVRRDMLMIALTFQEL